MSATGSGRALVATRTVRRRLDAKRGDIYRDVIAKSVAKAWIDYYTS